MQKTTMLVSGIFLLLLCSFVFLFINLDNLKTKVNSLENTRIKLGSDIKTQDDFNTLCNLPLTCFDILSKSRMDTQTPIEEDKNQTK